MSSEMDSLASDQEEYENRLKQIVERSIEQEKSIMDNLHSLDCDSPTLGQRIADKVASFGGSWTFIILFCIVLVSWIIFNVIALKKWRFDPYPFILMNLVLSCLAALQAPIIMMSQNRQEEKDRKESENDYMVNLKAEMQIRSLHEKMDILEADQIKKLFETQARQLEMLKKLDAKLDELLSKK
ncbi:MAG: DUF1003 domain-containing protein [Ferruginibacter sp.]